MDMRNMTPEEKALAQAQHRLEAMQARNRVKEQKARTRRLIQRGAILEKRFHSHYRWKTKNCSDTCTASFKTKAKAKTE